MAFRPLPGLAPPPCTVYSTQMKRPNLSEEIAGRLRHSIADGVLGSGQRINESELSEALEVSRTPLREALCRLDSEGFVTTRPRRGFFVRELGPREIEELYRIRAILDPAALELAGLPSADQIEALEALNRDLEREEDPARAVTIDDEWHRTLLSHCSNRILLDLIRRFMLRTRPLERAYLSDPDNVARAVSEHRVILALLAARDLEAAVWALRENMTSAIPVLAAVAGREGES